MRQRLARTAVVSVLMLWGTARAVGEKPDWQFLIVSGGRDAEQERGALVKVLQLLPRLPARVAVLDAAEAGPKVQDRLLRLDAFVLEASPVVYVVKQSALLRGAIAGSAFHTHALAAVIWHEMAHVDGADERDARAREEALWTRYVRDQRLDDLTALRYLAALKRRPDDRLLCVALFTERVPRDSGDGTYNPACGTSTIVPGERPRSW
jgi:hypothetical protein